MRVFALALWLVLLIGCGRSAEDGGRVRLAYMPRLTHASALTGIGSGRFEQAIGGARLEPHAFEVGNAIVEAMFAGEIDVAYLGPNPAINGFVRSGGRDVRVLAGAASGGSLFVVAKDSGIDEPADLRGKRIATPQIASTQDIALRSYLRKHGFASSLDGTDVIVMPLASSLIPPLLEQKQLDGAWVSEPLASALMIGAGARLFVDERDEWDGGHHLTTVLAVRGAFLEAHPELVARFAGAHVDETRWVENNREASLELTRDTMKRVSGRALPDAVARSAWARVSFTHDPMPSVLARHAHEARAAGFLPAAALSELVELRPLQSALRARVASGPPP
jgi:NitT/TauT family transport system substrate-binding protein